MSLETYEILYDLFTDMWETGIIPEEWKLGLIVKLPKKGDIGSGDRLYINFVDFRKAFDMADRYTLRYGEFLGIMESHANLLA